MKQKIKNYLKLGILLFGISIIAVNCTEDEQLPIEQTVDETSNFSYLKRTELPTDLIFSLNSSIVSPSKRENNFAKNLETSFGTILTEIVLLATDSTGIENYTFKVDLDDENPNTFYNLILRKEVDGTFSPPYLKKYTMDDAFFSDYSNGNSELDQFVGTVENIAIDDSIDIDTLLERQQNRNVPCIEPITDDGDINNPNDGNTGNTGGGGGGGTSGTGTGNTGGSGTGSGNTGGTGSSGSSDCTPIYDMVIVGYAWCDACGDGGSYQGVYQYQVVAWDCPSLKSSVTSYKTVGCPQDNGNIGTLEEDAPPCKRLKQLSSSDSFQQRMQELLNNTSGNTEISYWGSNSGLNGMNYADADRNESAANEREIRPNPPTSPIDSYIHNHSFVTQQDANGNNVTHKPFSIFSGADLYTLFNMYVNGLIEDLGTFTIILATPGQSNATTDDDSVYAITISNKQQFINVANALSVDPIFIDNSYRNPKHFVSPQISTQLQEQNLAKLLKDKKYGMELYRGNKDDLSDWTKIKVKNNGEVVDDNCN